MIAVGRASTGSWATGSGGSGGSDRQRWGVSLLTAQFTVAGDRKAMLNASIISEHVRSARVADTEAVTAGSGSPRRRAHHRAKSRSTDRTAPLGPIIR